MTRADVAEKICTALEADETITDPSIYTSVTRGPVVYLTVDGVDYVLTIEEA